MRGGAGLTSSLGVQKDRPTWWTESSSEEYQGLVDLLAESFEHLVDSELTCREQCVEIGATQQHGVGAQCQSEASIPSRAPH